MGPPAGPARGPGGHDDLGRGRAMQIKPIGIDLGRTACSVVARGRARLGGEQAHWSHASGRCASSVPTGECFAPHDRASLRTWHSPAQGSHGHRAAGWGQREGEMAHRTAAASSMLTSHRNAPGLRAGESLPASWSLTSSAPLPRRRHTLPLRLIRYLFLDTALRARYKVPLMGIIGRLEARSPGPAPFVRSPNGRSSRNDRRPYQ